MLHILLVILKFIGILLAAVLGFFFFLLLIVLFAPIRYKACGEAGDGKTFFLLKVNWLFIVLRGRVAYTKDGILFGLRIFGFLLFSNEEAFREKKEEKAKRRKSKKEKNEHKKKRLPMKEEAGDKQEEAGDWQEENQEKEADREGKTKNARKKDGGADRTNPGNRKELDSEISFQQEKLQTAEKNGEANALPPGTHGETEQESKLEALKRRLEILIERWKKKVRQIPNAVCRLKDKIWSLKDKITLTQDKIGAFFGKIDQLKERVSQIKEFWDREGTKKAKIRLLKDGKAILLHLLPRKCRGRISFGFNDPALMGSILAVLGILMPLYRDRLIVEPDFEETKFFGEISLKGRIIPGYLLMKGLFLLLDKNIRKTIKEVKQLTGGN